MTQSKLTLGQAIDQIIGALESLEPDTRATAIETVCAHLKIPIAKPGVGEGTLAASPSREKSEHPSIPSTAASSSPSTDIRSLKAQKNPRSAREMACVVAFYLQELAPEAERKESISTADLEKYFKQAQFKLPAKIAQVLPDAKGSGYFDSAARGAYRLNAVGYNLVAHKLPVSASGG